MVIVGTRPEIIRLSRIVKKIMDCLELVLVHTGQNFAYELSEVFFKDLGIPEPQYYLNASTGNLAETIGNIISRVDAVLEKEKPDAVLILGDTNSALSVIPVKRRKIPIFHYEAGNRCFDQRVPEEINRKIVDHTADINLTYSAIAKENLLREGIAMDRVLNIGSPMFEVLNYYEAKIEQSDIVSRTGLRAKEYLLLSSHREENVDEPGRLQKLVDIVTSVLEIYPFPIVFSIHPRTEKRLSESNIVFPDRVIRSKPFAFTDYIALQKNAFCVLSDSGTITEEAALLGFPAINIRETHERHEGMEKGAVMMVGFEKEAVLLAIKIATKSEFKIDRVEDYMQSSVSEKIVRIIVSYSDYIKRNVWRTK
jgi:UDP-N-acetylglucosamine 2-epimerase (non-hydrolysing)